MGCAVGASTIALLEAGETALTIGVRVAAVGVLALVAALVLGWSPLVPASLALVGAVYATHLALDDPPLDVAAPALAAALLLTAELGYWSLDERRPARGEAGADLRRLAVVVGLGLTALLVSAVLLALVDLVRARGLALDLVGAGAAAGALLVFVLAGRRRTATSG